MKLKKIVSSGLLIFVSVILFMILKKEFNTQNHNNKIITNIIPESNKLMVYYFHGNKRCHTCSNMENYTAGVIKNSFQKLKKEGKIKFQPINLDLKENEHFITDYQLIDRIVVLSLIENGQEIQFKKLDQVWDRIYDSLDFCSYIENEIKSFIPPGK